MSKKGGARVGSGRKEKFNEPTTTISFRVPASKANEVKHAVNQLLKLYAKAKD